MRRTAIWRISSISALRVFSPCSPRANASMSSNIPAARASPSSSEFVLYFASSRTYAPYVLRQSSAAVGSPPCSRANSPRRARSSISICFARLAATAFANSIAPFPADPSFARNKISLNQAKPIPAWEVCMYVVTRRYIVTDRSNALCDNAHTRIFAVVDLETAKASGN